MSKGVFIHNPSSQYDDRPESRYHFPKRYLSRVTPLVGEWILYYESRKNGGTMAYKAIAQVEAVRPDPDLADHYYADMKRGSYLGFAKEVPLRDDGGEIVNSYLRNENGKISAGRAVSAVQPISDADFWKIVDRGLTTHDLPRVDEVVGMADEAAPFIQDSPRKRVEITREVRDRVFRKSILTAYDQRCAFTGLSFINGGGRAEVQAAHIRAVAADGPDIVSNGLALSGTAHWMFDRGLLTLNLNGTIEISRQVNDRDGTERLLVPDRKALLPEPIHLRPHPQYLAWHRETVFKS